MKDWMEESKKQGGVMKKRDGGRKIEWGERERIKKIDTMGGEVDDGMGEGGQKDKRGMEYRRGRGKKRKG